MDILLIPLSYFILKSRIRKFQINVNLLYSNVFPGLVPEVKDLLVHEEEIL